jgi:hypothetical protein
MAGGLELGRWEVSDGFQEAAVVEPVDPSKVAYSTWAMPF